MDLEVNGSMTLPCPIAVHQSWGQVRAPSTQLRGDEVSPTADFLVASEGDLKHPTPWTHKMREPPGDCLPRRQTRQHSAPTELTGAPAAGGGSDVKHYIQEAPLCHSWTPIALESGAHMSIEEAKLHSKTSCAVRLRRYAGSVWRSTITVMQLATLDFWSEVAIALFEISPLSLVTICFTLFLLNFGVINHLVAIMVDRVSNISGEAAEMHEKLLSKAHDTLIKGLEQDLRLGIGMDGKLSLAAFHKLIEMPAVNQKLQLMGISDEEAQAFFDIMEGDRHGGITIHQFVMGLSKAKGKAKSSDMCTLICVVNRQTSRATKLVSRVRSLIQEAGGTPNDLAVDALQKRFNDLGKGFWLRGLTRERMIVREQEERLSALQQRKRDTDVFHQSMELQRQYAQVRVKLQ
eukprot:s3041_g5.t1